MCDGVHINQYLVTPTGTYHSLHTPTLSWRSHQTEIFWAVLQAQHVYYLATDFLWCEVRGLWGGPSQKLQLVFLEIVHGGFWGRLFQLSCCRDQTLFTLTFSTVQDTNIQNVLINNGIFFSLICMHAVLWLLHTQRYYIHFPNSWYQNYIK